MFCKQCGFSMNDDVKFCPNCGSPTEAPTPAPQPQPQQAAPAPAPQPQSQQAAPAPTPAPQPQSQQAAPAPQSQPQSQQAAPTAAPQPQPQQAAPAPTPAPQPQSQQAAPAPAPAPQPQLQQQYAQPQPQYAQQQYAQPQQYNQQMPNQFSQNSSRIMNEILDLIKQFFSSTPTKAVVTAAKSNSFAWIVIAVIGAFVNGLATFVLAKGTIGKVTALISMYTGDLVSYGMIFFLSFLFGLLLFALTAGSLRLVMLISNKNTTFSRVANVVAVASLPIISVLIVNMLVTFIYPLAALLLLATSVLMAVILLYVGLQQLDRFEKSPYWLFSGMLFVIVLIGSLIFGGFVKSILSDVMQSAMGGFGGFGSFF